MTKECVECKGGINLCDVSKPQNITDGIIQDEPLEYQRNGAGYILRTRMEHSREHIQHIKAQILKDQEIRKVLEHKRDEIKSYMNAEGGNASSIGLYRFITDLLSDNPWTVVI